MSTQWHASLRLWPLCADTQRTGVHCKTAAGVITVALLISLTVRRRLAAVALYNETDTVLITTRRSPVIIIIIIIIIMYAAAADDNASTVACLLYELYDSNHATRQK